MIETSRGGRGGCQD